MLPEAKQNDLVAFLSMLRGTREAPLQSL